ncbi:hypothetical protein COV49_01270 [Candidatus Falkowbacteria bacterium CG11_big_fil_rev_8_21_14_0_20_39_10]|uniref:Uncharacterized protein n=1 Tax=Candidatus Falkowbacteria bacterium CG11_big_fil_rev_8_21_14_0_20_39_10 TaxID=1974570 RepID=A0A2M6K9Q5_9BACT|nr:MAG: hypothetical protein COV49_01270 [Candidatus Falkowbacteria bacterium CG11_big_fil_rev_8_21_14_0_20_39_10]
MKWILLGIGLIIPAFLLFSKIKEVPSLFKGKKDEKTSNIIIGILVGLAILTFSTIWIKWLGPSLVGGAIPDLENSLWKNILSDMLLVVIFLIIQNLFLKGSSLDSMVNTKKNGIVLIALIAVAIHGIQIYYSMPKNGPLLNANTYSAIIPKTAKTLNTGDYQFNLTNGQQTSFLEIPGNMVYSVYLPDEQGDFALYYNDGTVVEFRDGENKELPRKTFVNP